MTMQKDLSRLTSIDEHGGHLSIIPGEVRGMFRTRRTWIQGILLLIFLALPWIHINGNPLILLNVVEREFRIFGLLFKSHDAPLIFFLLMAFALSLAFVTAVWGRVWCGWACPQTVFIDAVYRRIELWTEGNYVERRKLQSSGWTWTKIRKTGLKWFLFILVSSLISHSFIAYFTGSKELVEMIQGSPEANWTYFLLVVSVTLVLLFNFSWFREQFCVIMCPYGRIQSVLIDPSSVSIVYNEKRGEPRRNPEVKTSKLGDCVGCNRCVEVCPTGIDIRNGLQMECIACTACIDACDDIMKKVNKPKGLIAYRTLNGIPFKIFNFKTTVYGILILISIVGLAFNLNDRGAVNIAILRAIESPYTILENNDKRAQILNHFRMHLINQTDADLSYKIFLSEADIKLGLKLTIAQNPIFLKAKKSQTAHMFVQFDSQNLSAQGQLKTKIYIQPEQGDVIDREVTLIGPAK